MPRRRRSAETTPPSNPPKRRRSTANSRAARDALLGGNEHNGRRIAISDAVFLENNKVLNKLDSNKGTELKCEELQLNIKENRKAHYTDEYEHPDLIVRRGQAFEINLVFQREFDQKNDKIVLQFVVGSRPQESKGTVIRIPVLADGEKLKDDWQAFLKKSDGKTITIEIHSSCEAIFGRYRLFVNTTSPGENDEILQVRQEFEDVIYILFNPWCPDDDVYVANQEEREEYVLNETGRIWIGTSRSNDGHPWNFGQFEDVALNAALFLLDKGELYDGARSNPVSVIRCLSALTNSMDDQGVLEGRWTDEYPKSCTVPWAWTGSIAILEEYMKKKKSVKFGQCWVFSGLITTLMRAIGIPTRSVTNFESAHDTDSSMTIDYHWNEEGEPLADMNDSVWNFHVWNESFFRRHDLPEGNDGWQAFDATPQEASEGVMRCGPAPVKAIKEGTVYLPYDLPFIFSEVNGDKVHWTVKEDGSMEPRSVESTEVGKQISTKAVGSNGLNDLTSLYKYGEGSEKERAAVAKAFRYSSRRQHKIYGLGDPDVKMTLQVPDDVEIGKDFDLKVLLHNLCEESRSVRVKLSSMVAYYTGVPNDRLNSETFEQTVPAKSDVTVTMHFKHDDYEKKLKPDSVIQVYLQGEVKETKRSYSHIESVALKRPGLTLTAPKEASVGEEFELSITFFNPLSEQLTGASFLIEASGISKGITVPHKKAIGPGEEITETITLSPRRSGKKEIIATFTSDQLSDVIGTTEIYVKYSY